MNINEIYSGCREQFSDLIELSEKSGLFPYSGYRSYQQQAMIYAQGRTKPGKIVSNAAPGLSFHQYGLAIDFVFHDRIGQPSWNGNYQLLDNIIHQINLKYGPNLFEHGDRGYVDLPHVQCVYGTTPQELKVIYLKNMRLQDVWDYLDKIRGA